MAWPKWGADGQMGFEQHMFIPAEGMAGAGPAPLLFLPPAELEGFAPLPYWPIASWPVGGFEGLPPWLCWPADGFESLAVSWPVADRARARKRARKRARQREARALAAEKASREPHTAPDACEELSQSCQQEAEGSSEAVKQLQDDGKELHLQLEDAQARGEADLPSQNLKRLACCKEIIDRLLQLLGREVHGTEATSETTLLLEHEAQLSELHTAVCSLKAAHQVTEDELGTMRTALVERDRLKVQAEEEHRVRIANLQRELQRAEEVREEELGTMRAALAERDRLQAVAEEEDRVRFANLQRELQQAEEAMLELQDEGKKLRFRLENAEVSRVKDCEGLVEEESLWATITRSLLVPCDGSTATREPVKASEAPAVLAPQDTLDVPCDYHECLVELQAILSKFPFRKQSHETEKETLAAEPLFAFRSLLSDLRAATDGLQTKLQALREVATCPLTLSVFRRPMLAPDGHSYEMGPIAKWLRMKGASPVTRQPLRMNQLLRNRPLEKILEILSYGHCDVPDEADDELVEEMFQESPVHLALELALRGASSEVQPTASAGQDLVVAIEEQREDLALALLEGSVEHAILVGTYGEYQAPLHTIALIRGMPAVALALINHSDYTSQSVYMGPDHSISGLHLAAALGHRSFCEAFISTVGSVFAIMPVLADVSVRVCDRDLRFTFGMSAIDIARSHGHIDLAQRLEMAV